MHHSYHQYVFAILFTGFAFAPVRADTPIEAQLREIRETWVSIPKSVNSGRYESTTKLTRGAWNGPQKIATESSTKQTMTPAGYLVESRTHLTDDGKRVFDGRSLFVANEHYSASLLDAKDLNQFVAPDPPKTQEPNWSEKLTERVKTRVCLPWLFPTDTFSISDLIDPKISDITKIEPLAGGLIRIAFGLRADLTPGEQEKFRGVISGSLTLNGDHHYRLESAEFRFDPLFFQLTTIQLSYDKSPHKDYFLKRIDSDATFIGRDKIPATAKSVVEYKCHHNIFCDPRAFYVSHYGLPEVKGIQPPKKRLPHNLFFEQPIIALPD